MTLCEGLPFPLLSGERAEGISTGCVDNGRRRSYTAGHLLKSVDRKAVTLNEAKGLLRATYEVLRCAQHDRCVIR